MLCDEEAAYLIAYNQAALDEERFLKQKAKIEWLAVGDSNTSYFHKSVKSRVQRNRIDVVRDMKNNEYEGAAVAMAFVKHYEFFLGVESATTPLQTPDLFYNQLPSNVHDSMFYDELKDIHHTIDHSIIHATILEWKSNLIKAIRRKLQSTVSYAFWISILKAHL
nr:hypothetical protein [Tanacetum cinerariifolium]